MQNYTLIAQAHLIDEFGRTGAQFINQIHYWLKKKNVGVIHNDKKWIYNTAEEWAKQLRVSTRTIRTYINIFLNKQIIEVKKLSKHKSNRTNYITLNYEALSEKLSDNKKEKTSQPLGKKCPMVIQKITNKEINKSEILNSKEFQKNENASISSNQVEQVKNDLKTLEEQNNKPLKLNTAKDMIDLWNHFFPKSHSKLTSDLSRNLVAAFKYKFKYDMDLWKHYLKRIESSTYLMGESFHLSLYWALKFLTVDRIEQGDFGVKDIAVAVNVDDLKEKVEAHIASLDESDRLKDIRFKIATVIGFQSYLSWFPSIFFFEGKDGIHLKATSPFMLDYVQNNYGYLFKKSLTSSM